MRLTSTGPLGSAVYFAFKHSGERPCTVGFESLSFVSLIPLDIATR